MEPNSSSTVLTVKSQPTVSLSRQLVLDEDDYTAGLSAIIARDFFPSLPHLDATNNYLSALESEDPSLIQASVRRLVNAANATPTPRVRNDGNTPFVSFPSNTPLRTPSLRSEQSSHRQLPYNPHLSLDEFQARYTSEDNASFTEILNDENEQRKQRHAWAWNAEDKASARKMKELEARRTMLIEATPSNSQETSATRKALLPSSAAGETNEQGNSGDYSMEEGNPGAAAECSTSIEETQSTIRHAIAKEEAVDIMAPRKDTRSASVAGWGFKARNSLMFAPDADVSPYSVDSSLMPKASGKAVPQINHANTRLPEQSEDPNSRQEPPSPSRSRIAAAISGTPYLPRSDSPKIRGFGFVDPVAAPNAAELGPQVVKDLMTIGTLLATPRVLSGTDDMGNDVTSPFVINAPNARDSLGRRLGGEAGRALSKKAELLGGSTPRATRASTSSHRHGDKLSASTPRRLDILTPAARKLLDRTRGLSSAPIPTPSLRKTGLLAGSTPLDNARRQRARQLDLRKVGWDSPRTSR